MMGVFEAIGMLVTTVVGVCAGWLTWLILGNIYGGILGAYRLRNLLHEDGAPRISHWRAIRLGLHCWPGRRYNGSTGEYWRIGGMEVPMDGRDKIRRSPFTGG